MLRCALITLSNRGKSN